jgi:hypothetical protein
MAAGLRPFNRFANTFVLIYSSEKEGPLVRPFLCIAALAVLLAPTAASAAVVVRIQNNPTVTGQLLQFDVYCDVPPGDTTDEKLDAFSIVVHSQGFTPTGVHFLPVEPPSNAHPYVFAGSGSAPEDFGTTYNQMFAVGTLSTGTVDIGASRNGLFTIPVFVGPDAQPGRVYTIGFDPTLFSLGGGPDLVATPGPPVTFFVPEPAAGALLPLGMLVLRRRRVA